MANNMDNSGSSFSTEPATRFVKPVVAERGMNFYPVHENELKSVSTLNGLALIFASIASALLSFAGTIWLSAEFEGTETAVTKVLSGYVAPAAIVLSVVFLGLSIYAIVKRGSIITVIKNESKLRVGNG